MEKSSKWQRKNAMPGNVDEVLNWTIEEIAQYQPCRAEFDLSKTFHKIYQLVLPQLSPVKMTLGIRTAPDTQSTIVGDCFGFCTIVLNIISQFINIANQGKVTIHVCQKADTLQLDFSSNAACDLTQIKAQLNVADKLCEHMGCTLKVTQTADERDTLQLVVPLQACDKTAQSKLQILIVEDNDINATVLAHFLEYLDGHVDRVVNGQEALDYVTKHHVDFIMLDLNMPVMDGYTACKLIRNNKTINQPIIIAVSANSTEASRQQCDESGMDAFLAKPYTTTELNAVMSQFL